MELEWRMPTLSVTISLRKDEIEALTTMMKKYGMKRHEAIKFVLRRFLFPGEGTVPLNGRHMHIIDHGPEIGVHTVGPVEGEGITIYESEGDRDERGRLRCIKEHGEDMGKKVFD